jgi:hypothetical protein
VNDIVRCSFSCNALEDISNIFDRIKKSTEFKIVKIKNRFVSPTFSNYRDLLVYVTLTAAGSRGFICEIQLNLNEFQNYSIQHGSYGYYLFFRYYFSGCVEDPKRLGARMKCIKKMDQIGENFSELDRFIEDFLSQGGYSIILFSSDLHMKFAFFEVFYFHLHMKFQPSDEG